MTHGLARGVIIVGMYVELKIINCGLGVCGGGEKSKSWIRAGALDREKEEHVALIRKLMDERRGSGDHLDDASSITVTANAIIDCDGHGERKKGMHFKVIHYFFNPSGHCHFFRIVCIVQC